MWAVQFWENKKGQRPVEDWFADLPKSDKKEIAKLFGLLELFGYELSLPHAKNLGGDLYELRSKSKGAGHRVYYTFQGEKIALLLVAGDKSSQERDIAKARNIIRSEL